MLLMRDWLVDHVRGRSLGITWPYPWDRMSASGLLHGVSILSRPAWCFSSTGQHLVISTSPQGVQTGSRWLREMGSWPASEGSIMSAAPPNFALQTDGTAMAQIVQRALMLKGEQAVGFRIIEAVLGLLNSVESIRITGWSEPDGFHYRGRIQFAGNF